MTLAALPQGATASKRKFCAGRALPRTAPGVCGGRGEIRTHETLAGLPVFKTGALNHSATLPRSAFQYTEFVGKSSTKPALAAWRDCAT
jgi:hypothetical protein